MRRARPDFDFLHELLKQRPLCFRFDFNIAIVQIANPTADAESLSASVRKPSEADSLHESLDNNVHTRLHTSDQARKISDTNIRNKPDTFNNIDCK